MEFPGLRLTKIGISVVWFVLLLVGNVGLLVHKLLAGKLLQLGELGLEVERPNHPTPLT